MDRGQRIEQKSGTPDSMVLKTRDGTGRIYPKKLMFLIILLRFLMVLQILTAFEAILEL